MSDMLKEIGNTYSSQIQVCSEICRKIVFALFAVVWALVYHDGKLIITNSLKVTTVALLIYLILDILQYFITALAHRKHFNETREVISTGVSIEEISKREAIIREKINIRSFKILFLKIAIMLPIVFISLLYTILYYPNPVK